MRADLHCHSTHSDGSYTPRELISLAKEIGLTALAITDHDAISSFDEVVEPEIALLSGVELSTTQGTTQVHVLGYAFDLKSKVMHDFCAACRHQRVERNELILEKLSSKGFVINKSDFVKATDDTVTAYGRPHIAFAMVKKGYVKSIQEAFKRYIGEGKSCYIPGKKYSVEEGIDIIHQAGGKAVIAHPHLIYEKNVVQELLKMDFDGLEAYYSKFPESVNMKWVKIAEEHDLLATGGSDFHGLAKPDVQLGSALCPEPTFQLLWNHFQSHK